MKQNQPTDPQTSRMKKMGDKCTCNYPNVWFPNATITFTAFYSTGVI